MVQVQQLLYKQTLLVFLCCCWCTQGNFSKCKFAAEFFIIVICLKVSVDLHGGTFHTMQCRATTTQENLLFCFCYAQEFSLFEIKMGLLFNIVTILFALSFLRVDFKQEDESYMAHNLKNESFSHTITTWYISIRIILPNIYL